MKLDVGSGHRKLDGYVGMDMIKFPDTDIQHDITVFPWPVEDSICTDIALRYIWGCIEPKKRIQVMDELWRIIHPDGRLTLQEQYDRHFLARQDPMYYSGANEFTWAYFDHRHNRYDVYRPKPWRTISAGIDEANGSCIIVVMKAKK